MLSFFEHGYTLDDNLERPMDYVMMNSLYYVTFFLNFVAEVTVRSQLNFSEILAWKVSLHSYEVMIYVNCVE